MESPAAKSPDPPSWRGSLQSLCLLGIVLIVLALTLDLIGAVRLKSAVAAVRAGGEPFTLDEIIARRPTCPPELDAAPVFLRLQARLAELSSDPKLDFFSFRRIGGRRSPLAYRWADEDLESMGTALKRLGPELEQLDALGSLPGGNLPVVLNEHGLITSQPEIRQMRLAVRLCWLRALYALQQGDPRPVLQDTATILRIARLVCTYPDSADGLVGCMCDEQAVSLVERACALAVLPGDELVALADRFAEAERQDPLYWALLGERASFFAAGQFMLNTGRSPSPEIPATGRWPGLRGVLMMDLAVGIGLQGRLVAQARDPGECLRIAGELEQQYSNLPRAYWLTKTLFPRPQMLCSLALERLARLRAARVGLAAERFRMDRGRFPERLVELVPAYLPEVPQDPYTGRGFRYRVDDQGALVYSDSAPIANGPGWGERRAGRPLSEAGFTLVAPGQRGRPASQPASVPGEG